jgi:hypothetical protein
VRVIVSAITAMLASGLAGTGAWPKGFVNERLDRSCATSAFGAAAETTIKLFGIPRQFVSRGNGVANIVIGNNVAGTHNHGTTNFRDLRPSSRDRHSWIVNRAGLRKRKTRILKRFQTTTQPGMNLSSGALRRIRQRLERLSELVNISEPFNRGPGYHL